MIRAFENQKRIATAVVLADKKILQVYPTKMPFENEEAFKAAYPAHEFRTEDRQTAERTTRTTGKMRAAEKNILIHSSLPRESDTPMQRLVRQIYFQTATRDSIRATAKDWQTSYYGSRADPGIYVMNPDSGVIYPVHFNRKSGLVIFHRQIQNMAPTEGLRFYRKDHSDLIPVVPTFQEQLPSQKAVVFEMIGSHANTKVVEQLQAAGFYVVYYMNNFRVQPEVQKALYRMIPNLIRVLGTGFSEEFYVNPPLENLDTPDWWRVTRCTVAKWIAENK